MTQPSMTQHLAPSLPPRSSVEPRSGRTSSPCPKVFSKEFPPGSTIVDEGQPNTGASQITSGAVLLSRLTQDGKRHVVAILGTGDIFGITDEEHYDCTVEAIAPTTIRTLQGLDGQVSARTQIVLNLQRQLEDARTHAVRLQRRSAEEKLASFLLSLPAVGWTHHRAGDERIMLSLNDAADYLSLRMETVSRVLSRFRQLGIISAKSRGRFTILDKAHLKSIADPSD